MSVLISHDLKFDVARIENELLDVNVAVSESFFGFAACSVKSLHQARVIMRGTHSAATAAGHRFYHHGITDFLRDLDRILVGRDDAVAAGGDRDARFARTSARGIFVAHRVHRARRRSDEFDAATFANFGEVRVLGKKTVTRMNRIDVANFGGAHDAIDFQITFRARRRADTDRFIGKLHVE